MLLYFILIYDYQNGSFFEEFNRLKCIRLNYLLKSL